MKINMYMHVCTSLHHTTRHTHTHTFFSIEIQEWWSGRIPVWVGRENFQISIFSKNFTPHPNWSSKTRTPILMCVVVIVVVVIVVVVIVVVGCYWLVGGLVGGLDYGLSWRLSWLLLLMWLLMRLLWLLCVVFVVCCCCDWCGVVWCGVVAVVAVGVVQKSQQPHKKPSKPNTHKPRILSLIIIMVASIIMIVFHQI